MVPPRRPLRARVRRRHCRAWRVPRGYFRRSRPMGALTGEPRVRTAAQPGTRFLSAVEREPAQDEPVNESEADQRAERARSPAWGGGEGVLALPVQGQRLDLLGCGKVVNINLVRDKKTGKSKGFCFLCYEDQRSMILAVDNFSGIKTKMKNRKKRQRRDRLGSTAQVTSLLFITQKEDIKEKGCLRF